MSEAVLLTAWMHAGLAGLQTEGCLVNGCFIHRLIDVHVIFGDDFERPKGFVVCKKGTVLLEGGSVVQRRNACVLSKGTSE
jgi:hypothetical protein